MILMREERKINKKILIALAMVALMTLPIIQVLAINPNSKAPTNGVGKSKNDHLYLFEKDEETWEIVDDPKWAKINFNNKQNKYVLNAHGLAPEADFELICYFDPWPGEGSVSLGNATSDSNGNLHMQNYIDITALHDAVPDTIDGEEVKIWLVPAGDFDNVQLKMVGWNPGEILFEFDLLNVDPIGW
jgi:hypothetical protein